MARIEETKLPGVGVRHDFKTEGGDHLGVITHRTGRRDLIVYDRRDPDACGTVVRLEEEDSNTLADLMGAAQVTQAAGELRQSVGGLTIDWLPIQPNWSCASCPVEHSGLQEHTGVTIVAVVRNGHTVPVPNSEFQLFPGDVAVVVGTPEGINRATTLLQGKPPINR
jgi:TrkA domain protein